jgi:hypothetical protein
VAVARPLRVLIRLGESESHLVRTQADKDWHVRCLEAGDFGSACSSDAYDALVVHPLDPIVGAGQGVSATRTYRTLQALGTPPLVFVFSVAHHGVLSTVIRLARHIPFEVATIWPDGRMEGLREAVRNAAAGRLAMRVVHAALLSRNTGILDPRLVTVMTDLFRRPRSYAMVDHAIALHNLTVTRINGMLSRAGLRSFEYQRRAARASLAYELIGRCGFSVCHAAKRVGCGSVDTLTRDVRKVAQLTPTEFAHGVESAEAAAALLAYMDSNARVLTALAPRAP